MKKLLTAVLALTATFGMAQINLEHTYTDGMVSRINLENSGEKYYVADYANKKIWLYNADHTAWKSINLPLPSGVTLNAVYHLSETLINADAQIEVAYTGYEVVNNMATWTSYVVNESGTVLLTVPGASSLFYYGAPSYKLIANIQSTPMAGKVYSVPGLIFEHEYTEGFVGFADLEISGRKYSIQTADNTLKLYNLNHTLWKTIVLDIPANTTANSVSHISETFLNTDSQIELAYSYYAVNNGMLQYTSKLIKEDGTVLLTVPNGSSIYGSQSAGLAKKLIAYLNNGSSSSGKVYSVPSLTLEQEYNSWVGRTVFENSGEKYYITDYTNKKIDIFNADHSAWKSVNLPIPAGGTLNGIYHVSEKGIDSDASLEIIYTFYNMNGSNIAYQSNVIKENGTVLLNVPNASSIFFTEISGRPNKLIANIQSGTSGGIVYGLPTYSHAAIDELVTDNNNIVLYPNPATDRVAIKSNQVTYNNITLINIYGQAILQISENNPSSIDISSLSSGHYFMVGKQDEKTIFIKKLVIQ